MQKQEFDSNGRLRRDELIEVIDTKPNHITYTFRNEGNTGVRNNGMRLEYTGSGNLGLKLGEARGLGFLVHGPASVTLGSSISITAEQVVEDEIFTINRAAFRYLATALQFHLAALKNSEIGGVNSREGKCRIHYSRHAEGLTAVKLLPADSIFALEERHGTLAYLIFHYNKEVFGRFYNLFHRKSEITVQIPTWFFDFDLDLAPDTNLPERFVLYIDGKKLGEYGFSRTELFL